MSGFYLANGSQYNKPNNQVCIPPLPVLLGKMREGEQ